MKSRTLNVEVVYPNMNELPVGASSQATIFNSENPPLAKLMTFKGEIELNLNGIVIVRFTQMLANKDVKSGKDSKVDYGCYELFRDMFRTKVTETSFKKDIEKSEGSERLSGLSGSQRFLLHSEASDSFKSPVMTQGRKSQIYMKGSGVKIDVAKVLTFKYRSGWTFPLESQTTINFIFHNVKFLLQLL